MHSYYYRPTIQLTQVFQQVKEFAAFLHEQTTPNYKHFAVNDFVNSYFIFPEIKCKLI